MQKTTIYGLVVRIIFGCVEGLVLVLSIVCFFFQEFCGVCLFCEWHEQRVC